MADGDGTGGNGAGGEPEYYKALPEAAQPFARTEDGTIKTLDQFVADIDGAFKWRGNSLRIPGPDASAEDIRTYQDKVIEKIPGLARLPNMEDPAAMKEHFGRLGRPDTPEGYKLPEGVQFEDAQIARMKTLAHHTNMTQRQFSDYVANVASVADTMGQEAAQRHEQDIAALKGEWGAAYEGNLGEIRAFLKTNKTTPPHVLEQLNQGNLPADQVRWLYSMASAVSLEGSEFYQQGGHDKPVMLTPQEAKARLEELNRKLYDRQTPPSAAEKATLQKRAEALTYLFKGLRPPDELLQYVA